MLLTMQLSVPPRPPRWVSQRKLLLIQKLSEKSHHADLRHALQVHAQAVRADLHRDAYVALRLISAFSRCRNIALAVKVFDQIPQPNSHLYNILIRAHVKNSQPGRAIKAFLAMLSNGVSPDDFTYSQVLRACDGNECLPLIQMIHARIEKCGFLAAIYVPNSLIHSYCKSGYVGVDSARKVFSAMRVRDLVSWNTMIAGLARLGEVDEARQLFDEIPDRDMLTWNAVIDGYAKAGKMSEAFGLFQRMPGRDNVAWSTVVDGFVKSGDIGMARILFDKMPEKNLITWTIMISAYVKNALLSEGFELYDQMEEAGFKPRPETVISILSACSASNVLGLRHKVQTFLKKRKKKRKNKKMTASQISV